MAVGYDIFVSYSKQDRSRVYSLVEAFEAAGFKVWIDREIRPGYWGPQIEAALHASRHVVVVLTRESTASGFVFAEANRGLARGEGVLVPVLLPDADPLPLTFEGLCWLSQQYRLDRCDRLDGHPDFERLCEHLRSGEARERAAAFGEVPAAADDGVERWLATGPSIDDLAMAVSVAVLETEAFDYIRDAAQTLAAHLNRVGDGATATTTAAEAAVHRKSLLLQSRSRQLGSIRAESFKTTHPNLGIEVERCRFTAPGYGRKLLTYIWRELDGLREPLCVWLAELAATAPTGVRSRLSFSLGLLAQTEFPAIFDRLVRPWILDGTAPELRQAADIILAVAGYEPKLEPVIKASLDRWAGAGASEAETRAVVELVTGSTGGIFPEWAFATLREAARASIDPDRLLSMLRQAVRQLVLRASTAADTSLWNIDVLFAKLADWVENPGRDEPLELPMFLFLSALSVIPLTDRNDHRGGLSLTALVARPTALDPCVRILGRALSGYQFRAPAGVAQDKLTETAPESAAASTARTVLDGQPRQLTTEKAFRDQATDRLTGWAKDPRRGDLAHDPVRTLAGALYDGAVTERDRDRIRFIFRNHYDLAALQAAPQLAVPAQERT